MTVGEALDCVPGPHSPSCAVHFGASRIFGNPCTCASRLAGLMRAERAQAARNAKPPAVWLFNVNAWDAFYAAHGPAERRFQMEMTYPEYEALIRVRADAKRAGDFAYADAIRRDLAFYGLTIQDQPGGAVRVTR